MVSPWHQSRARSEFPHRRVITKFQTFSQRLAGKALFRQHSAFWSTKPQKYQRDRPAGLLVRATFCYKNVVFKTDLIGRDLSPPKYDSQARSRPCESTYAHMQVCTYINKAVGINVHEPAQRGSGGRAVCFTHLKRLGQRVRQSVSQVLTAETQKSHNYTHAKGGANQ